MEPKRLDEILKDIYKFDPQLSQKEEELKRLIQDLMDLIPDTDFSEEFSINLRDRIIQTIQQKKLARISKTNNISFILRYFVG